MLYTNIGSPVIITVPFFERSIESSIGKITIQGKVVKIRLGRIMIQSYGVTRLSIDAMARVKFSQNISGVSTSSGSI